MISEDEDAVKPSCLSEKLFSNSAPIILEEIMQPDLGCEPQTHDGSNHADTAHLLDVGSKPSELAVSW